jgi:hypothetical protein
VAAVDGVLVPEERRPSDSEERLGGVVLTALGRD